MVMSNMQNEQTTVLVVGGQYRLNKLNLYPKLERAGLKVHERSEKLVYKRSTSEKQDRIIIPNEVDAVLILHDLMSHSIFNAARAAAEAAGKRVIGITRHWSRTQGYLLDAGLISNPIQEEEEIMPDTTIQDASYEPVYRRKIPDFTNPKDTPTPHIEIPNHFLLKPGQTCAEAGITPNQTRYNTLKAERRRIVKFFLERKYYVNDWYGLNEKLKSLGLGGADPRGWYEVKVELGYAEKREWKPSLGNRGPRKPKLLALDPKPVEVTNNTPQQQYQQPAPVEREVVVASTSAQRGNLHSMYPNIVEASDKERFSHHITEIRKIMKTMNMRSVLVPHDGDVEVEIVTTASQSWKI